MSRPRKQPTSISLVLGAGGARGLAHIGVIRALEARGYDIQVIAGSSMGALVGGIYAMGELETYAEWVGGLEQTDVLRLLDWTLAGGGLIRGRRIIDKLRELIGDRDIEDLDLPFTAVAVDIDRGREVWLNRGPLFDAVRASIAIPGIFTPHRYLGCTMIDGGILNPVPVAPTLSTVTDLTLVVDANAAPGPPLPLDTEAAARHKPLRRDTPGLDWLRDFLDNIGMSGEGRSDVDTQLGLAAVLSRSLETMQAAITRQHLAVFSPDIVVRVPKNACMVHEFHKAKPMIALGERIAREALERHEASVAQEE